MKDHIYSQIELTGTSTVSIEDAVQKAVRHAHQAGKSASWFQVTETRGSIEKGKIEHWQVSIKIGILVED
jgi:dodecin